MEKRGQVTLFVIIGIVALIIVGLIIFLTKVIKSEVPPETEITEPIPEQLEPIREHVQLCAFKVAKEGLIKLGQHGGYIYPQEFAIIPIPMIPTSSSGLEFAPESNITIPYWYYLQSSNRCQKECLFASKKPPLHRRYGSKSVEVQLDNYIIENLDACLDFSVFVQEIKPIGEITPTTTIGEKDISIYFEYPLEVKHENKVSIITQYKTYVDLNLKRIFDIGTQILYLEMDKDIKYFDRLTMQIVDGYSSGYNPKIPPTAGDTDLDFSKTQTWLVHEVKEELESKLMQNVPLVQIDGSKRSKVYVHEQDFFFNNIYNSFLVGLYAVPVEELSQVDIDFIYINWWPSYLNIEPNAGGLIQPESISAPIPFFPLTMKTYEFTYDISYPIVVSLTDDSAFKNQGYTFQFAFEVNVRNNRGINSTFESFKVETGGLNPFADYRNWNSGLIEVKSQDSLSGAPVDEVPVSYICSLDSVFMGMTGMKEGEAILETRFPICHGGFITGLKKGYYGLSTPLNTRLNESDSVVLEMEPVVTKELEVKRRLIRKESFGGFATRWALAENSSLDLEIDETAMIVFTKQTRIGEADFVKFVQMKGSDLELPTIELVTGDYIVEAFVLLDVGENTTRPDGIVIPERTIEVDDEEITIPAIEFEDTFYEGGLLLDPTTQGYFTITEEDLEKDKLIVYVATVKTSDLNIAQDLDVLSDNSYYSNSALYPEWE